MTDLARRPLRTAIGFSVIPLAAIGITGCSIDVDLGDDATRRVEHDSVPAADIRLVDVETENGAVEVVGASGDEIEIRSILRERRDGDAAAAIAVDGDQLVISGECDSRWWQHCSVAFEVAVPPDLDVRISTDNGRIEVSGVDGGLEIDTDNGAIDGSTLRSDSVEARTDNGRIDLSFDAPPATVRTETDNGAISVRVPDGAAMFAVDVDTRNGAVDVDVRTDPAADRSITARSDNGAIEIGYRAS